MTSVRSVLPWYFPGIFISIRDGFHVATCLPFSALHVNAHRCNMSNYVNDYCSLNDRKEERLNVLLNRKDGSFRDSGKCSRNFFFFF